VRRAFGLAVLVFAAAASAVAADAPARRMIVLGVDGLDPVMLRQYMDQGVTPNLKRLAESGGFESLGTSIPPQSPVAWSNFITGMDSGGHGLFDFIAIDRKTLVPYLSASKVEPSGSKTLSLGQWRLPLGSDKTVLLRDGVAFWELLDQHGIPATIFQVPANYPPLPAGEGVLSGMGTPDLRGTPGTFSFYTDDPAIRAGPVSGGVIERISVSDGVASGVLEGPPNAFLADSPPATIGFTVQPDPVNPVVLFSIGEEKRLLKVGEWSDWIRVHFSMVPGLVDVPGMIRVYPQHNRPRFGFYISPVNIDPRDPAQPISHPGKYANDLAEAVGPFYTQEMPEDTKALSNHILSPQEFVQQTELVMDERRRLLRHELDRYRQQQGHRFLFFYLSTVDQRNHMLAREMDPTHPAYDPDTPKQLVDAMRDTYREVDQMVGWILDGLQPGTDFVVMSDHGFAPFKRGANLNTWLEKNGYLTLLNPRQRDRNNWLAGINWKRTRAFSIGLNALYINVKGRERDGIVAPEKRESLAREIAQKLGEWKDPENDQLVVTQPAVREDVYHGKHVEDAPDLIVGYARGYRASWDTSTGKVPADLLVDNEEEWSGDHCMDSRAVPGVLLANRPLKPGASLLDLPVTILKQFGIEKPPQMTGTSIW
jgi:predicted AlkP superfamily phosphohydrolase/phosphomutase